MVLYTSSMCAMMKQKADISKTRQLLQAKKVDFTEQGERALRGLARTRKEDALCMHGQKGRYKLNRGG